MEVTQNSQASTSQLTKEEKVVIGLAATLLSGGVFFALMHLKPVRALFKAL